MTTSVSSSPHQGDGQVIRVRFLPSLLSLSLSPDRPLPEDVRAIIHEELSYTHRISLRRGEVYGGRVYDRDTVVAEKRRMFFEEGPYIICPVGFQYRIRKILTRLGKRWEEINHIKSVEPGPKGWPKPDRYRTDFDRLHERMILRARQDECMAAMESRDYGQIGAPPGFGKTHLLAAYAVSHPDARIHIVTDSLDVQDTIWNRVSKYVSGVGLVNGSSHRWGRVTVISAGSLHKVEFKDPTSPRFADTVLVDEADELMSPHFLEQLRRYRCCRMYALSATLAHRFDGAHAQLEAFFGEKVFEMTYEEAVNLGLVAPIRIEWLPVDGSDPTALCNHSMLRKKWGIWAHDRRNDIIASRVSRIADDQQVLVMVDTVEHALELKRRLPHFRLCYDGKSMPPARYRKAVEAGLIDPAKEPFLSPKMRNNLARRFESREEMRVIATDVWSRGVSFDELQVLVRADGRSSKRMDVQGPGRVSRIGDGSKDYGLVIDCWDTWSDASLRSSRSRSQSYRVQGWDQPFLETMRRGRS